MGFGAKIKEFGKNKFKTITKFSQIIEVDRQSLYRYFNDEVTPGADFLKKLIDLGCDPFWLFTDLTEEEYRQRVSDEKQKELDAVWAKLKELGINTQEEFEEIFGEDENILFLSEYIKHKKAKSKSAKTNIIKHDSTEKKYSKVAEKKQKYKRKRK